MRDRGPFLFSAAGPTGALGCGLALFFLGVFLMTPLAIILIKGVGWLLVVIGLILSVVAIWTFLRARRF